MRARCRLSVSISITRAIEGGMINSRVSDSRAAPVADIPCPRAIAASMTGFGSPTGKGKLGTMPLLPGGIPRYVPFFAVASTAARTELKAGSGPYTSFMSLSSCPTRRSTHT